MLQPDRQRLEHIRDYCIEIKKTIIRYGESFEAFDSDADYQRSVSFCILQIGELSGGLSVEFRKATADRIQWGPIKGMAESGGAQLWQHEQGYHLGNCCHRYSSPSGVL